MTSDDTEGHARALPGASEDDDAEGHSRVHGTAETPPSPDADQDDDVAGHVQPDRLRDPLRDHDS